MNTKKVAKALGASRIQNVGKGIPTHQCSGFPITDSHGDGCMEKQLRSRIAAMELALKDTLACHLGHFKYQSCAHHIQCEQALVPRKEC